MNAHEKMRAAVNRNLVANQVGAETYDKVCHTRGNGRIAVVEELHTIEELESISKEVSLEDYWD